jgi:hypothetical protein
MKEYRRGAVAGHDAPSMDLRREDTPEERAAQAKAIADNLDRYQQVVVSSVEALTAASAVGDRDAWLAARKAADAALRELTSAASHATRVVQEAADPVTADRLAAAEALVVAMSAFVERAPASPEIRSPTLSCERALLDALPPDRPVADAHQVYAASESAVVEVLAQMSYSDFVALKAILKSHPDHEIARRLGRFTADRRKRLLGALDDPKALARARALERTGDAAKPPPIPAGFTPSTGRAPMSIPGAEPLVSARTEPVAAGDLESATGQSSGTPASGQPLPGAVRTSMESAFGADFGNVGVREGGDADAVGALAYAQGSTLHFSAGAYDPASADGRELIGHELAHVVQQREGRVPNRDANGSTAIDDPALEQEADAWGARAARGESVPRGEAAAATAPATDGFESVSWLEDDVAGEHRHAGSEPVQRKRKKKPKKAKAEKLYVPYQIHVTTTITGDEYKALAMNQVFGGPIDGLDWQEIRDTYEPNTYTLQVEAELLQRLRGVANAERGIDVDESGAVVAAAERWQDFDDGAGESRDAILEEMDRRYYEASGVSPGQLIKPDEKGRAALWRTIRDEVLFQHEYLFMTLPDRVKELFSATLGDRVPTPREYDRMFQIAKKIERMPGGHAYDFVSKIVSATPDLDALDAALDAYSAEMATRGQQAEEREVVKTKLLGLEEVYKKYQDYKFYLLVEAATVVGMTVPGVGRVAPLSDPIREELETQLHAHGYASIAEFEQFIQRFEDAFELESANIAKDLLTRYMSRLYKESERYKDPIEIADLHRKLGGLRTNYGAFAKDQKIWHDHIRKKQAARVPGQWQLQPTAEEVQEAEAARDRAVAAKAASEAEVHGLADAHPIFQEDGLPIDKRIDKAALAQASEAELGPLLQAHIARRTGDVSDVLGRLDGKPELIYKMDKLMPEFFARQGIAGGSIHEEIIRDKMHQDAIAKLVADIVLAIVAIALTVVSMGSATPALVAAGAAMGAAGIGAYSAYEEIQEYDEQKDLAEAGLTDDPSMLWVVLAVVGVGVDAAAAVRALKALAPAAKAVEAGGDLADFSRAVQALEESGELDARVARATERAAAARRGVAAAKEQLVRTLSSKAYSFPGPLADPAVYRDVVKLALAYVKQGVADAAAFIADLRSARAATPLGELTDEELALAKEAWEEGRKLHARRTSLSVERGKATAKTEAEADTILQAEIEGRVTGEARRTDRSLSEPDLDFRMVDTATNTPLNYVDIKTPVDPAHRALSVQAKDIADKVSLYDADVEVIIDFKNLAPADKATLVQELANLGVADAGRVKFLNQP